jgi:hypothetical protein
MLVSLLLLLLLLLLVLLLSADVGGSRDLRLEVEEAMLNVSRLFSSARRRSTGLELGTRTPLEVTAHLPEMKASSDDMMISDDDNDDVIIRQCL